MSETQKGTLETWGTISIPEPPPIRYERTTNVGDVYTSESFEGAADEILKLVRGLDALEVETPVEITFNQQWDESDLERLKKALGSQTALQRKVTK